MLHAHLPYVRSANPGSLEEDWFFQALMECYLPLLQVLESSLKVEEQKAKLINMVNTFKKIPSVLDISAGEMIKSKRAIVDSSYDVGFVMQYKSIEAMESYLQHPLHKKAVEEVLSPLAKKVLVYDIGIQGD